jgi:hypothetical protein
MHTGGRPVARAKGGEGRLVYANEGALFDSRDPGNDNVVVDRGADWAFSIEPPADGGGEAVGASRCLRMTDSPCSSA